MKIIGYARVSTVEQNLDLQLLALRAAGCAEFYTDHGISGADFSRPGLTEALDCLKRGNMLVVWRLDRLGRSLIDLIGLVSELGERGIEFRSLNESIDTSSSGGRLLFHLLAAMAEFERSLISERTQAGMEAARARGQRIGRKPAITVAQRRKARLALEDGSASVEALAERYKLHPRTLLRALKDVMLQDAAG